MKLITIISVFVLIIWGCSSEKAAIKPLSDETLKVKEAIEILLKLNKAYENKDALTFMRYISPTAPPIHEERIKKDFDLYDKISLNTIVRWAKIKEDIINLAVHWEGRWYDRAGKEVRDRGNGIFFFKDEEGLRLVKIEGDNPFGISGEK